MKIWQGFGSEHSYRLVMIGQFADAHSARAVAEKFERLAEVAEGAWPDEGWGQPSERLEAGLREALYEFKLYDLGRSDVDNFVFEHSVHVDGNQIRIDTDEGEVQGFLKVLIDAGAKVEVFSGHNWNDDGTPRGRDAEQSGPEQPEE